jgi:SAM-dependent methyltransferase
MEWFEDEAFWRELYPYMFPPERFAAAPDQVAQILTLANLPGANVSGRTVLDLCCGPGRHAVEFARQGLQVTGVDRTQFLLDCARERSVEAGVQVEWVMEDMRRFLRPATYDLAASLFTSFGYFEDEEDDLTVLRNVHRSLTPGGVFVIDVTGKERVARHWKDAFTQEFPDGALLLQRPHVLDGWSRIRNQWTLIRNGSTRTFKFEHWIYSGRELKDRLHAAGFEEVRLFGDLQGAPYDLDATRLIAVARKPLRDL